MHREKLEGTIHGDFIISEYLGSKKYKLTCIICGETKEVLATNIKHGYGKTCSKKKKAVVDLTGQHIGEWEVLQYIGDKKYWCRCSCGKECEVRKTNLINGSSKSCGHAKNNYGNLIGQRFGDWTVIGKDGYKYIVKCSCGNIGTALARDLVNGRTLSCGHNTNKFVDLTGQQFGRWTVLETLTSGMCKCICSCESKTTKLVRKQDLLRGASKSCGCIKSDLIRQTLFERYGEIAPNKTNNARNIDSITAISSKESLAKYISKLGYKPTAMQLSKELEIGLSRTLVLIHKYKLEEIVDINSTSSYKELEVLDFIKSIYNGCILHKNKDILHPKELDIYIPEKKLAIEFNGNYWHSDIYKDKYYHQQKTIDCAKQGIQLIHIFEYEWDNEYKQNIIKEILKNKLIDTTKLYARQCKIVDVDKDIANKFNSMYHLQGECNTELNIGLAYNDDIVALISIGKPRFNHEYEYEILRLTFKSGIHIIGGTEKIFKHIISKYEPESIITYCDISKFKGNVYTRLGFKPMNDKSITEPNYVWYNVENGNTLSRYQTQKKKLVKQSLGTDDDTESSIMNRFGYIKIYDSGNLRLEYIKN